MGTLKAKSVLDVRTLFGEPFPVLSILQKYQNRAFNLIESSKIKDAYNRNVLNVRELIVFDRAVMTFKIVNMLCPEGLQNKLTKRSALSNYNTRNMKNLHVQTKIRTYQKKLFVHSSEHLEHYPTGPSKC